MMKKTDISEDDEKHISQVENGVPEANEATSQETIEKLNKEMEILQTENNALKSKLEQYSEELDTIEAFRKLNPEMTSISIG